MSWTEHKSKDGVFRLLDRGGDFYEFRPTGDRLELPGKNWRDGKPIENLRLTPGGRYLHPGDRCRG